MFLAFRLKFPIFYQDFERLKALSQFIRDSSSWEMNLTQTMTSENPIVKHFLNKTVPLIVQLVLKKMDLCSANMKGLVVKPNKLILMEPGKDLAINQIRKTGIKSSTLCKLSESTNESYGFRFVWFVVGTVSSRKWA